MTATKLRAKPRRGPSRSATPDLDPGHPHRDTQGAAAGVNPLTPGQTSADTHRSSAGGDLRHDHTSRELQSVIVVATPLPPATQAPTPKPLAPGANHLPTASARTSPIDVALSATLVALSAANLDDIEHIRKAISNRLRAMRDDHHLETTPEYRRTALILEAVEAAEHQATLELKRALRQHPLGGWVKTTVGIGEKQGARLLAALDDPYWNHAEDRPRRGPAELWAYCGLKPGQRRQKGVKSNWNAAAKMRSHLCAESCIKHAHSPYRAVYDRARASWADRDTTDLHKHNHALRVVAKAILADLWRAGKEAAA